MMKVEFVDLKKQYLSIKTEINKAMASVIENTAFIKGKNVENFERDFAELIKIKHCIGVGNGTDALVIALRSLNIGVGDEVITVANSFIATSEAITAIGARVVFIDADSQTYNIDVKKIEEKITSKTKAIIPVHLYGQPADMLEIVSIAKKHNLFIIEDSAQAHLAEYQNVDGSWQKVGTFGDLSTFSFFPGKNLGAYGDAGAVVTNNDNLAEKVRKFANHGRIAKYNHEFEGYNSRLDGLQSAILNVKLKYINIWTERRREVARKYSELFSTVPQIITPYVNHKTKPAWHLYVIQAQKRDELQKFLKENGIATGIHYPIALPNLQAYQYLGHNESDFPIASRLQNEILSLPIFPEITQQEIEFVANNIKKFYLDEK